MAAALLPSSTVSQIPVVPTVTCDQCDRTIGTGSIQYATGRCVCGTSLAATCRGCGRVWEGDEAAPTYCEACQDERAAGLTA
jgi:hypothetical protein